MKLLESRNIALSGPPESFRRSSTATPSSSRVDSIIIPLITSEASRPLGC